MEKQLAQLEDLKKELQAVTPKTAFLANAISALGAVGDNIKWHAEFQAAKAAEAAKEPAAKPSEKRS